jgi:hypothetical protein
MPRRRRSTPYASAGRPACRPAVLESLENRRLLSAVADPVAVPTDGPPAPGTASATPQGYTPAQIDGAYGISNIKFGGVTGDGAGQTIAIIDAYDDPDLVDSTSSGFDSSDLHQFDVAMGLPDPPSFIKVDENGDSSYPAAATGDNAGWALESALDVEWAHAIAPDADIILVETYSANISDLIQGAMQYIDSVPGVSVVNMSFDVGEFNDESQYDDSLVTPSDHQGITVLAASGDTGSGASYPSASPDAVSVGSTSLTVSGDSYSGETGAPDSGGGPSADETKPSYQSGVDSSDMRDTPDVSIDGNPNTGIAVYDSSNGGPDTPWYKVGGSSGAAVLWSGLIAIADQGRVADGGTTLNGPTQTLPALYSLGSSDFHDITSGSNGGYSAGSGYDLVTGLGTPVANELVPALAASDVTVTTNDTPARLAFAVQPSDATTGQAIVPKVVVDVENSGGGVVTTDDSPVMLGIDGGSTSLDGITTVTAVNGVATFSDIYIPTAGSYRLVASDGDLPAITSAGFNVSAPTVTTPVPSKLAFSQQPTTVTAGSVMSSPITVQVLDSSGNVVQTDDSFVTLSVASGPSGATLGGVTTVNAIDGVATFSDVTVSTAGTIILAASDGSLTPANSSSFSVNPVVVVPPPPTSSKVVFAQQPVGTIAGTPIASSVVVQLEDSAGAVVTTDDSAVTLSIATGPAGATLGGTVTVHAVDGVATFTGITPSTAGTYFLAASDGALTPTTSASFTVTPAGTLLPTIVNDNLPAAVVAGVKLRGTVVVYLTNSAANTSSGPVTTSVYANATDGTRTLLGTVTNKLKVAADKTARVTVPVPLIPAALDGSYTLQAVTTDTAGNPSSSPAGSTFAAAAPFIALTPGVSRITLAAAVVGGSNTKGSAVVKVSNTGNIASTGLTTVGIYASPDGSAADATLISSVTKRLTIKPGGSTSVSVPLKLIPASLDGSYTILARVTDPASAVTSTPTRTTVNIAPPFVSIAATAVAVSQGTVAPGKSATLSITLENNGNIAATGQATIGIGLSSDGVTQAASITSLLKTVTLPVGRPVVLHLKFTIPAATAAGTYYPLVTYDQDGDSTQTVGTAGFDVSQVSVFSSALT